MNSAFLLQRALNLLRTRQTNVNDIDFPSVRVHFYSWPHISCPLHGLVEFKINYRFTITSIKFLAGPAVTWSSESLSHPMGHLWHALSETVLKKCRHQEKFILTENELWAEEWKELPYLMLMGWIWQVKPFLFHCYLMFTLPQEVQLCWNAFFATFICFNRVIMLCYKRLLRLLQKMWHSAT